VDLIQYLVPIRLLAVAVDLLTFQEEVRQAPMEVPAVAAVVIQVVLHKLVARVIHLIPVLHRVIPVDLVQLEMLLT
jgi:hypothetical protein